MSLDTASGTEDGPDRRGTILAVDDEPGLADLYRAYLDGPHEVRTATGGEAALDAVDGAVDVVLLDRRMPDLPGDAVLSEIRAAELGCCVAMITANEPDADLLELPFDAYLVKPVDGDELRSVVDRLLARREYDDRMRAYTRAVERAAMVEATLPACALEDDERYARLRRRIDRLEAELESVRREFTLEDIHALLGDPEPP